MNDAEAKEFYGADAAEWLRRWDENRNVWSIEMGGVGPGYEQAIQITMAEILRHMVEAKYDVDLWQDKNVWAKDRDLIDDVVMRIPVIRGLGLSGAQWGAALNLAGHFYRNGPAGVMTDDRVKDRHIQVQRDFPAVA